MRKTLFILAGLMLLATGWVITEEQQFFYFYSATSRGPYGLTAYGPGRCSLHRKPASGLVFSVPFAEYLQLSSILSILTSLH